MESTQLAGATPRQRDFIETLLAERDYTLGTEVTVNSPADASNLINTLLRSPRRLVPLRDAEMDEALSSVQKSKYAVPTSELMLELFDEPITGDLLFLEVREYRGTLYLRRLHGALGGFTRTKMSRRDTLSLLRHIARDTYKYARIFGEHYSCCGKCGADLTDEKSRRFQLGPDCRKAWGF